MAQRECVAMQSGRFSVPSFSPMKGSEVANTGLQSIAENKGTSKKPLIHMISRNDVSTSSQIMKPNPISVKDSYSTRLSTKKPKYESIGNALSRPSNTNNKVLEGKYSSRLTSNRTSQLVAPGVLKHVNSESFLKQQQGGGGAGKIQKGSRLRLHQDCSAISSGGPQPPEGGEDFGAPALVESSHSGRSVIKETSKLRKRMDDHLIGNLHAKINIMNQI